MSQNCNRLANLSEAQFDAKAATARAAAAATGDAFSDCYKAIGIVHSGEGMDRAVVYLTSAMIKLDLADAALARNKEILECAPVEPAAACWLRDLDFDRLYADGLRDGLIPANEVQPRSTGQFS